MKNMAELCKATNVTSSALCNAMDVPRATYYRYQEKNKQTVSANKMNHSANTLSLQEKENVLALMHNERFVDKTPYQIFYTLLDEGHYYCSIRTMYRLLESQGESQDRRDQRCHRDAVKPELIATAPNQVWSWDITKLKSTRRLVYYYLYVILDIFSRYVVGWLLADRECKQLARQLIQTTALRQGIQRGQLTLHADNGPSMTSGTVAQLLDHLGVIKSHNRPYTSNDNPFSESQFKTFKYCPHFPERFDHEKQAEIFSRTFFDDWYNPCHYHSGIEYLTPESVHYGFAEDILEKRYQTLLQSYLKNPVRFNNKPPRRKILQPVYINPPKIVTIGGLQTEKIMA